MDWSRIENQLRSRREEFLLQDHNTSRSIAKEHSPAKTMHYIPSRTNTRLRPEGKYHTLSTSQTEGHNLQKDPKLLGKGGNVSKIIPPIPLPYSPAPAIALPSTPTIPCREKRKVEGKGSQLLPQKGDS
jgi:hypothetical protein